MGRADSEIQTILSHLTVIYWNTGCSRRPSGVDSIQIDRLVHRLLVLRGSIKMDDKVPMDPWQLFLDEYAPGGTTMDDPVIEKPAFQSYPNSILLRSTSSSSSTASDHGHQHSNTTTTRSSNSNFQLAQGQGQSQSQDVRNARAGGVESERHIRFDSNLPGRLRHRRFPVSPAPHSRV